MCCGSVGWKDVDVAVTLAVGRGYQHGGLAEIRGGWRTEVGAAVATRSRIRSRCCPWAEEGGRGEGAMGEMYTTM